MVIRLFCNAGMSTSILVRKMQEAARQKGKGADRVNEKLEISCFQIISHAGQQDQMMSVETFKVMAEKFISLYQKLSMNGIKTGS